MSDFFSDLEHAVRRVASNVSTEVSFVAKASPAEIPKSNAQLPGLIF